MIVPTRSMLFVPGDSERKIEKSRTSGADAIVLDLEDSVSPERKTFARDLVASTVANNIYPATTAVWVRINSLSAPGALHDLAAVVSARPTGILQPKVDGPSDVNRLSLYLDALEVREGIPLGSTEILPVVTETARAPFSLGHYQDAGLTRLMGLTWGAEDLSAAIGAFANTDEVGRWSLTYRTVRSLTLLAAKACGVQLIETLYADFKDMAGLHSSCVAARREGFTGRFAIHPDQVATINQAFTPGPEEIAFAERVVAAFAERPDAGTLGLDGRMLDRPHLDQARLVLAMHDALQARAESRQ